MTTRNLIGSVAAVVVGAGAVAAAPPSAPAARPPALGGAEPAWIAVQISRLDDFFFADAEFLVFVTLRLPDVDPNNVIVTTGDGVTTVPFEGQPGDEYWDEELAFDDLASLRATLDGTWTVEIEGPLPSLSTFTLDAASIEDAELFATATDVFPPNGAVDVPPDVVFSWSDPTGGATADGLFVFVEGDGEDAAEQEDDSILGTMDVGDESWDPPLDLEPGFNEFSVLYVDFDDLGRASALTVEEGEIAWGSPPYAPDGYPTATPLVGLGSETIVGFVVAGGCPEDLSGNGAVDFADILAVLAAWGPCEGCPEDLDESGAVDFADVLAILAAWGPCD